MMTSPQTPPPPDPATPEATFRATVRGRVQGVGFRFFVYGAARRLGLAGSVANQPDGSVAVRARGPRERLDELLRLLRTGPPLGRVDDVDVRWGAPVNESGEFTIGNMR
jgi:acylphosphatase